MIFVQSDLHRILTKFQKFRQINTFFREIRFVDLEHDINFLREAKLCQFSGSCREIWFDEKIVNFSSKHTLHVIFTSIWKEFFNWITHMSSNETHMLPDSRANTFLFEMYSNTFQRHLHTYSCIWKYSFVVVLLNVNYNPLFYKSKDENADGLAYGLQILCICICTLVT